MTIAEKVTGRRRGAPPREHLDGVKAWLVRVAGVRLDLAKLDDGEQRTLVDLVLRASAPEGGTNLTLLDKGDLRRLERLVEQGAGLPAGEFGRRRDEAKMRSKVEELAVRARRPAGPPALLREGTVVLPPLGDDLKGGYLWGEHLAIITLLAAVFADGRPVAPSQSFEGDTLVVDARLGLFGGALDPDGRTVRWREDVKHLAGAGWFEVEQRGQTFRIRPGRRLLDARRPA